METSQISSSEEQMKSYYESLSEKDRRRYAAIEANKRGYGGIGQIGLLLGCNYRTISKGIAELKQPNLLNSDSGRPITRQSSISSAQSSKNESLWQQRTSQ